MSAPPKPTASGVKVEIAVQPPVVAGVDRILQPAFIARTCDQKLIRGHEGGSTIFATLALNASTGQDMTTLVAGQTSVSAQILEDQAFGSSGSSSSSSSNLKKWLYFIFHPIGVNVAGIFNFVVWVHDFQDNASVVVGYNATRDFTVMEKIPATQRPSMSILWYLRRRVRACGMGANEIHR